MDLEPSHAPPGTVVVLVKDFASAKARLAPALSAPQRSALAEQMAAGVLAAAEQIEGRLATVVVGDTAEVARWATARGARGLVQPEPGLDAAARAGWAAATGGAWTMIAHADLADPGALPEVIAHWAPGRAVLVPDRHRDGTNVMVLPAEVTPPFAYGPGSYARHRSACAAMGLEVHSLTDTGLSHDVDSPADLSGDVPGQ